MKALDTNVLIRFLVKDDTRQSDRVYRLFKQAEAENDFFRIPLLVVLEMIWVLESVYAVSRPRILDSIAALLSMSILKFETHGTLQAFIFLARDSQCDLSDLLIAASAQASGCERVLSFDKKACRHDLFEPMDAA